MLPWKHLGLLQDGIKSICVLGKKGRRITRTGLEKDGKGSKDLEYFSFTGVFLLYLCLQTLPNFYIYISIYTHILCSAWKTGIRIDALLSQGQLMAF